MDTKYEWDFTFDHDGKRYWLHKDTGGLECGVHEVRLIVTDARGKLETHEVDLHIDRNTLEGE